MPHRRLLVVSAVMCLPLSRTPFLSASRHRRCVLDFSPRGYDVAHRGVTVSVESQRSEKSRCQQYKFRLSHGSRLRTFPRCTSHNSPVRLFGIPSTLSTPVTSQLLITMSRPLISSLRTLASSSSRVGVRGILTGSTGASRGGTKAQARPQGAIGGVDPRIFSGNGVDGFLGPAELSRLNEWQSGLWTRLQAEVRSKFKSTVSRY